VYSLYAVWRAQTAVYKRLALGLAFVAALEVLSGTALALLSTKLSASELGVHIALYLGACLAAELLLFTKMKDVSRFFPLTVAVSPILASLCFIAVASSGL
jgi:hypothetical protein